MPVPISNKKFWCLKIMAWLKFIELLAWVSLRVAVVSFNVWVITKKF